MDKSNMSFECPISTIYHANAEQKKTFKNAAKIHQFGSQKLRDLLREKCRIRIKNARQQAFSQNRPEAVLSEQISLNSILRQELAELEQDLTLQDEIYNEFKDEINIWYAEQLEEEQNYLIEVATSQELVCPICQVSNLVIYHHSEVTFNYRCRCNANFISPFNVTYLRAKLSQSIDVHEQKCCSKINFFVNPLTNHLEGMCDNCEYFCSL